MDRLPDVFDHVERNLIVLPESRKVEIGTQEIKQKQVFVFVFFLKQLLTLGKTKSCKRYEMES